MTGRMLYPIRKAAAVLLMTAGIVAAAFLSASGQETAENPGQTEEEGEPSFTQEEVHVTIPGMEGSRKILWISDMHIFSYPDDPDVAAEQQEEAGERASVFTNTEGITSCENWEQLSSRIDSYCADYVVFGADMIDYVSVANLNALQEGLARVKTPWMYIRADHDYGRWYVDMGIKKMRKLHRQIAPQNKIWIQRFEEFTLVGLDNTTSAVDDETLQEFRKVCGEGKPVLLCMHVPIDQREGNAEASGTVQTLAQASEENWGGRILCWGEGDEYDTLSSDNMRELTDMIYEPGSPVAAVFAGHLHLTWDGSLTPSCTEHVFGAAYEDHIGVITVSG